MLTSRASEVMPSVSVMVMPCAICSRTRRLVSIPSSVPLSVSVA